MASPGFGELDPDQEDDFGSLLAPRRSAPSPQEASVQELAPAKQPAAKKTAKKAAAKKASQKAAAAPAKAAEPAAEQTPAPAAEAAPEAPARRPRRGRPPGAGSRTSTRQSTSGTLVLWTPVSIRSRMQALRATDGTLYLDQVLDALESGIEDLPDLVADQTEARTVSTGLFVREQHAPVSDEHRKQLTIRGVLASQLEVIDQLVDTTGAGSRSRLINIALDRHLPTS